MFHKAQTKLSFICCLATSLIVLVIILCCLKVSEKTMYGKEKALFLLEANTISTDLHLGDNIDIAWYNRHHAQENILYIETNGRPSTLSALILSEQEISYINEIKEYLTGKQLTKAATAEDADVSRHSLRYDSASHRFLVMHERLTEKDPQVSYLYLYCLDGYYSNIRMQRIRFGSIWLASILILYVFSHVFTSHVLKPLIQNDERQRHFVAVASHELRSPLAVFKTGLSILKSKSDSAKTTHIFSLMENEMSRMERLIQDLLCLSKAENATWSFLREPVALDHLLQGIYEKFAATAADKNLFLSLSTADGCDYNCLCDRQRIEQAITILIDNALSYTPAGEQISLNLFYAHRKYYIQVADTGTGIPDSEKEKIFGRFYQVNSSHSHKGHFGLGLSIAWEICHAHGGRLSVSDTNGGGSTFTIKLPKY